MPDKAPNDKRRYLRARVSLLADCSAQLAEPRRTEALIEDVSAGGLRIQLTDSSVAAAFAMNTPVRGEILSENPAMQMQFSGKIAWLSELTIDSSTVLRVGIAFDDNVVLSEMLQSLQPLRSGDSL